MKHLKIFEEYDTEQRKNFTDSEISRNERIWLSLPYKYTENSFFSSVWKTMKNKKSLSKKQWTELEFLFKYGKSRYEAGQLSSKH